MSVTDGDRERAREIRQGFLERAATPPGLEEAIAAALADERERARAPFLAYVDKCEAIGNDRKAGLMKRAVNRSVAEAFRRAAEESQ